MGYVCVCVWEKEREEVTLNMNNKTRWGMINKSIA